MDFQMILVNETNRWVVTNIEINILGKLLHLSSHILKLPKVRWLVVHSFTK